MKPRILVFIPTYDEADNVTTMTEQLSATVPAADLLFIDDNSPDGTGRILDGLVASYPRLTVRHRDGKRGIGGAHAEGIRYAYEHDYDLLVTLDCDFTHLPADIPRLLAKIDNADLVVGSRFMEEDGLPGWNPMRRFLTNFGHTLTSNVLGMAGDATGAFRVYNLRSIPSGLFDLVSARGYAFFFESLYILQKNDLRVVEVPIKLPARTYGHSKMDAREVRRSVEQLVTLAVANAINPARFRLPKPLPPIDPSLVDTQNWNGYWESKERATTLAYDLIASTYRSLVIKRRLEEALRAELGPGSSLLHAGCGSGRVDQDLHERFAITAVDISIGALEIYRRENPNAHALVHASIFALPFADESFDGAYNLGVVEHFHAPELRAIFTELHRVIKPGGKLVVFWPHARAPSVAVLGVAHFVLNDVLDKEVQLHPPEVTLIHDEAEARSLLADSGFSMRSYTFGPRDGFIQAIVVADRS